MYYDGVVFKPNLDDYFLEHHGIKGQKWGVKNGPPYPLDSSKSTGSKLKKSSGKKSPSKTKSKDGKYGSAALAAYIATILVVDSAMAILPVAVSAISDIPLDKQQKVEYVKAKARYKKLKELRKGTEKDKETGLRLKKNKDATPEEDMAMVNALRGKRSKTKGTYDNCARCTAAYDLRRRGFEVHANYDKTRSGVSTEDIESWYKNGKHTEFKEPKDSSDLSAHAKVMLNTLSKQPDSRGNLCLAWNLGGGHSVAYEVKNHKVTVYNTQRNEKLEGKELEEYMSHAVTHRSGLNSWYMRTDNLEPNYDVLKKKGIIKT